MKTKGIYFVIMAILILSFVSPSYASTLSEREKGDRDGAYFGEIRGELEGFKDYLKDDKEYWRNAPPSDKEIRKEYDLDDKSSTYRYHFLGEFKSAFKDGYEGIFDELGSKITVDSKDSGVKHGQLFGGLLGQIYGKRDFYAGKINNWIESIPSYEDIINDYSLIRYYPDYKTGFVIGFIEKFEESYSSSFRETNVENNMITIENGMNHGETVGMNIGSMMGNIDYNLGKKNMWAESIPSRDRIISDYNLLNENEDYMEGFINGYMDGYKKGYVETYQRVNLEDAMEKHEYFQVGMEGGNFATSDGNLNIKIDKGTLYIDTFIETDKHNFPSELTGSKLEPTNNIYDVIMTNEIGEVTLRNPITLSFKYYGPKNASIYKKKGDKWLYLPSYIEGDKVYTEISCGKYYGGTYTVFIHKNKPQLIDVKGHWVKDEIETFIMREYITGYSDGTFKPEKNVSRGEFVTILNRMLDWKGPVKEVNLKDFKDNMVFGLYSNSIANALSRGYINGYPDKTFRPTMPITYQEIEWMIARLPGNKYFKWNKISENLLNEKGIRSKSVDSMKNHISRAEVVYLLHYLEEKGLLY